MNDIKIILQIKKSSINLKQDKYHKNYCAFKYEINSSLDIC